MIFVVLKSWQHHIYDTVSMKNKKMDKLKALLQTLTPISEKEFEDSKSDFYEVI